MTPDDLLIAIAGHGLHPSPASRHRASVGDGSLAGAASGAQPRAGARLALHAVDCGALPVTTAQREDLTDRLALAQDRRSEADRCLDEVVAALDRQGIETCLLHGAATAALDYDEPGFASMTRCTSSSLRRNRRRP